MNVVLSIRIQLKSFSDPFVTRSHGMASSAVVTTIMEQEQCLIILVFDGFFLLHC